MHIYSRKYVRLPFPHVLHSTSSPPFSRLDVPGRSFWDINNLFPSLKINLDFHHSNLCSRQVTPLRFGLWALSTAALIIRLIMMPCFYIHLHIYIHLSHILILLLIISVSLSFSLYFFFHSHFSACACACVLVYVSVCPPPPHPPSLFLSFLIIISVCMRFCFSLSLSVCLSFTLLYWIRIYMNTR